MTEWFAQISARLVPIEPAQLTGYLLEADTCTLGRLPLCQIVLPYAIVSRVHARIERTGSQYTITDLNSTNGTYVDGRQIYAPHLLIDGALIGLGNANPVLRFELICSPITS